MGGWVVTSGSVSDSDSDPVPDSVPVPDSGACVSVDSGVFVDSGDFVSVLVLLPISEVVSFGSLSGSANAPIPITEIIIRAARNAERRRNTFIFLFFILHFQPLAVLSFRILVK